MTVSAGTTAKIRSKLTKKGLKKLKKQKKIKATITITVTKGSQTATKKKSKSRSRRRRRRRKEEVSRGVRRVAAAALVATGLALAGLGCGDDEDSGGSQPSGEDALERLRAGCEQARRLGSADGGAPAIQRVRGALRTQQGIVVALRLGAEGVESGRSELRRPGLAEAHERLLATYMRGAQGRLAAEGALRASTPS